MGLIASDTGGSSLPPIPEDIHHAICYAVYDLGTHYQEKWDKEVHKVLIIFELPGQRIDIEKDEGKVNLPRAISKRYTLSLHQKADLRKDLESWRGKVFTEEELKGFDLKKLLGINCNIQILHTNSDGKTYSNISTVTKLPKNVKSKNPENKISFYSFEDGLEFPEEMPEWVQKICKDSKEYQYITDAQNDVDGAANQTEEQTPPEDDLPF